MLSEEDVARMIAEAIEEEETNYPLAGPQDEDRPEPEN